MPLARHYMLEPQESHISFIVKYTLFFLNFLFWAIGVCLVAIGSWALATKQIEYLQKVTSIWDLLVDVSAILLVIGLFVILFSTLGCVGALRENVCMLKTFAIILILIVVVLLTVGILGFALSSVYLNAIKEKLSTKMIERYWDDIDLQDIMDWVQESFECCGLSERGYHDWNDNVYFSCALQYRNKSYPFCSVPKSCCVPSHFQADTFVNIMCGGGMLRKSILDASKFIYTRNCVDSVVSWVKKYVYIICAIILGVMIVPLFQICLGLTLSSQIQRQKQRWETTYRARLPPPPRRRAPRPVHLYYS